MPEWTLNAGYVYLGEREVIKYYIISRSRLQEYYKIIDEGRTVSERIRYLFKL